MVELTFTFPLDCLQGVGEVCGHQYGLPAGAAFSGPPVILDIGANCGAYTIWARMNYSGCRVIAYEPQPDIFKFLAGNLAAIPETTVINAAVGDPAAPVLRRGTHSRLCSSQYELGEQSDIAIPISVLPPEKLPPADLIKIDAEGAEAYIVEHLPYVPAALIMEIHGAANRRRVEDALAGKMQLASVRMITTTIGIFCYLRT